MLDIKKLNKTLRLGIEFELFTLDEDGFIIDGADRLITRVRREFPKIQIKRECAKNMIEIITSPHTEVPDVMLTALEDFQNVIISAKKEKIILYAYGTYPGAFVPKIRPDQRYITQQKILGKQRFLAAGRCIGLHFHFSLPWGVFNDLEKAIKPLIQSRNITSMLNVYNLCIAMDPALTTFSQSSPFYQGKRLGKDSRIMMYRGGSPFDSPNGLYANFPNLGALQQYKSTNTDILHLIAERFSQWKEVLSNVGCNIYSFLKYRSVLDSAWNPVKINPHGTMEIRGTDMNHPDVIIAIAVLVKFIIKAIQEKYIQVVSSDTAIDKPFRFDGERIYIPPNTHVIGILQRLSAYEGLENDEIHKYCDALLQLGKKFIPEDRLPLLLPLEVFLKNRKTASDRIIAEAATLNVEEGSISPKKAAELAVKLSQDLYLEIEVTKKRLHSLYGK
ncbi:MAG: hypothetical protein WC101_05055 [Candidatus Gracilibacteria bacterium]